MIQTLPIRQMKNGGTVIHAGGQDGFQTLVEMNVPAQPPLEDIWIFPRLLMRSGLAMGHTIEEGYSEKTTSITIYKTEAEAKAAFEGEKGRAGTETIERSETQTSPKETITITHVVKIVGAGKNEVEQITTTERKRGIVPLEVQMLVELATPQGAIWLTPFTVTPKKSTNVQNEAWSPITQYVDLQNPLALYPGEQLIVKVKAFAVLNGNAKSGNATIWLSEAQNSEEAPAVEEGRGTISLFYVPQPYLRSSAIDRGASGLVRR